MPLPFRTDLGLSEALAAYRVALAACPAPFEPGPRDAHQNAVRASWAVYYSAVACGMPRENVNGAVAWAERHLAERMAATVANAERRRVA